MIIQPVGAGYDSLIPITDNGYPGPYIQDQCMNTCSGIADIGNEVNLATPGYQRLASVVVAFRNTGPEVNPGGSPDVGITVNVGGRSVTQYPDIAAGNTNGRPTVTDATFDFSQAPTKFITSGVTYSISYPDTTESASLNVALSNSYYDFSAGSDSTPGSIWLQTNGTNVSGDGDFPPACTDPGSSTNFQAYVTTCGDPAGDNPGAYGTATDVANGNADIPAVEINTVGGVVTDLSPGVSLPVNFAIRNAGTTAVHVTSVTTSIGTIVTPAGCNTPATTGTDNPWYRINGPDPVNLTIPPGQTILPASTTTITMVDSGDSQNACEGAIVPLTFTSN